MRRFFMNIVVAAAIALAGCSGPKPEVATAYNDQYGAVKTSMLGKCPTIEGVWHLANLSGGSLTLADGQAIQHFRWFAPYLFGLSITRQDYIAIKPKSLETVLYLANKIPVASGQSVSYTALEDAETPCVGYGWRQVEKHYHSTNDAAARVLNLVPEQPVQITQTDYIAQTPDNALLIATRIDYSGTDREDSAKKINTGYWHFIKMPRLHEDPTAQGFK